MPRGAADILREQAQYNLRALAAQQRRDEKVAEAKAKKQAVKGAKKAGVASAKAGGQKGAAARQAGRAAANGARENYQPPAPPEAPPSFIPADDNNGAPPGIPDWLTGIIGSFQPQPVPPTPGLSGMDPTASPERQAGVFYGEGSGYGDNVAQGQRLFNEEKARGAA